jgi:uncharacterized protein YjlB
VPTFKRWHHSHSHKSGAKLSRGHASSETVVAHKGILCIGAGSVLIACAGSSEKENEAGVDLALLAGTSPHSIRRTYSNYRFSCAPAYIS